MTKTVHIMPLIVHLALALTAPAISQTGDLRDRALPEQSRIHEGQTAANYHSEPIDLDGQANREPLVDLRAAGIAAESFYARTDGLNAPYYHSFKTSDRAVRLRATVVQKLKTVNQTLKPYGVEVFVLDGYRSPECQKELWQYFLAQAKKSRPQATSAEQIEIASRYCSNPTGFNPADSKTWSCHSTGGAVDLTIRQIGKNELYMGGIFDDDSKISHTAYYEDGADSASALAARRNRRLLYWAMTSAGFVNYPYEWWHYDYGDQLWLFNRKKNGETNLSGVKAIYGLPAAAVKLNHVTPGSLQKGRGRL